MKCDLQFVVLGIGDYDESSDRRKAVPGRAFKHYELGRTCQKDLRGSGYPAYALPEGTLRKNQMIAMRYGMLPVVRETARQDTVKPHDPKTGEGNGFTFSDYTR